MVRRVDLAVREVPLNKGPFHPAFDCAQASVSALPVMYSISGASLLWRFVLIISFIRNQATRCRDSPSFPSS